MILDEVYKKLAEEHKLTPDIIRQIHLDFWKGVKKIVQEDTAKDIMLGNFGTLYFDEYNLRAATKEYEERHIANEQFLKDGGDWMKYLYVYRSIARHQNHINKLWKSLNKRKNRIKGERGL